MVDTSKDDGEDGGKDPFKDNNADEPPKRQHQRRRSKSRCDKESNTGTGENNTLENAEDSNALIEPAPEEEGREEGQSNPDEPVENDNSEDSSYMPPSEDEISLGNKDFIVPEESLEQERFKQQLIATTRSLKRKHQRLQAEQDTLNNRWTQVLAAEEYGLERPTKSYPKRKLLPQLDDEALEPEPTARNG